LVRRRGVVVEQVEGEVRGAWRPGGVALFVLAGVFGLDVEGHPLEEAAPAAWGLELVLVIEGREQFGVAVAMEFAHLDAALGHRR
jgi:hypothetical protein